ncbi:MAG: ester cyclase [Parasphingorhabdus sp.]|nr:ester cyclase [Parasphingorhabdus sp.]
MTALALWGRTLAQQLAPSGPRRQPMAGFDECYADIIDYIIRCTHRIWEERGLDLIDSHYSADCPVWTMAGPVFGAAVVKANTIKTLESFPDRTLVGDAVIWSGDDRTGYLSSHRITSHATNLGASEFGPATGRQITFTTIADCLCLENRIIEEWLVRDNAAIVRQLGFDIVALAAAQAAADQASGPAAWRQEAMAKVRDLTKPVFETAKPDPATAPLDFACWYFARILQSPTPEAIAAAYAPTAIVNLPDAVRVPGHTAIAGAGAAIFDCFTDGAFTLDHIGSVVEGPYTDIALRWSYTARHSEDGRYGAATGRDFYILAVTHLRTIDGQIAENGPYLTSLH